MKKLFGIIISMVLLATMVSFQPAYALGPTDETIYGTISTVNADGTITVTSSDGIAYTVSTPVGTDPTTLVIGGLVKLTGTVDDLGIFTLGALQFNQNPNGYFCSQSLLPQPAGQKFAEQFGADYLSVQWMFCNDKLGWGEIRNMLKFSEATGVDTATLQAARDEGQGWGQIFKMFQPKQDNPNKPLEPGKGNNGNGNQGNGNNGNGNNGNGNGHKP